MKNLTSRMMIAAAALAVAVGAASAQPMKADVPFAFQAGTKAMPAGSYSVSIDPIKSIVNIHDADGKNSVLILPSYRMGHPDDVAGKLVFSCAAGNCTLIEAWSGWSGRNYAFAQPKHQAPGASLMVIRLHK